MTARLLQIEKLFIELPAGSERQHAVKDLSLELAPGETCLLYTSDAADE